MKITKTRLKQIIQEELETIRLDEQTAQDLMGTGNRGARPPSEYRGEVGFGDWESRAINDPEVAAAMRRVSQHLAALVKNGTFRQAAREQGVSEGLIYGTVFDELMRWTPTALSADPRDPMGAAGGAYEWAAQNIGDDPRVGSRIAALGGPQPAVGIASIKPDALFALIDAGYLNNLDIPAEVRDERDMQSALEWITGNPEASIMIVGARHRKMKDDWSNLNDPDRPPGWEPDEATLATMYSLPDSKTKPRTRAERVAAGSTPDPQASGRGKRITDIPAADKDYQTAAAAAEVEELDAIQADYEELHYPEPAESDAEYIEYPTSPSYDEETIEIEDEEDVKPVPMKENILQKMIQEELSSLSEARRRGGGFSIEKAARMSPFGHHADVADPRGISEPLNTAAVTFEQWRLEVLEHLPHMHDAWEMDVSPEEYANNLKAELSMEAPTDRLARSYARGEI